MVIILIGLTVASCAGESRTTASISDVSETVSANPPPAPQTTTVDIAPPTQTTVSPTTPRDPALFQPLGSENCDPRSPFLPWPDSASEGTVEVRATSEVLEVWGLIWGVPPLPVDEEVKMVWRVTGDGDFGIRAIQGSVEADLVGPRTHSGSNFERPGEEWGTTFVFPSPRCWEIHLTRGSEEARVWLEVAGGRSRGE